MLRNLTLISMLALGTLGACKKSDGAPPAADNTAKNQRDKDVVPTADQAIATSSDVDMTQKIRKAVMDDSSLSTNAHNCKIVVENGKVTLVGPVASADESTKLASIAASVAGGTNVTNQLEVAN